jgi:hypothetical protein
MDEIEPKDQASMENELEPQQYTAANTRHFPKKPNKIQKEKNINQLQKKIPVLSFPGAGDDRRDHHP